MGLRERLLYGKDKAFGEWFHQQCIYVRNNAEVARKRSIKQSLASYIGINQDVIGPSLQALFVTYLVLSIASDKGEDYLGKRLTSISTITQTVLGPSTADIYAHIMQEIPVQQTTPESILTHALVDNLKLPLSHERQAQELVFNFLDEALTELYIPCLYETFSHNPKMVQDLLSEMGHSK